MKVLMLGGTGLMGLPLSEYLLSSGVEVYVTTRGIEQKQKVSGVKYIVGNAMCQAFLNAIVEEKYDIIIDFMYYEDLSVFEERIDWILSNCGHYYFMSSARVYSGGDCPITEQTTRLIDSVKDRKYLSSNNYSIFKAKAENVLHHVNRYNYSIIRPYIIYGHSRLPLGGFEKEYWLKRVIADQEIIVPEGFSRKKTTITKNTDVARIICELVINKKRPEVINIASNECVLWDDVVSLYRKLCKRYFFKDLKLYEVPRNMIFHYVDRYDYLYDRYFDRIFDISELEKLSDVSFTDLEDGMREIFSTISKKSEGFLDNEGDAGYYLDRCLRWNRDKDITKVKKEKIIIYGAGATYRNNIHYIESYYTIAGVYDRDILKIGNRINGYVVHSSAELKIEDKKIPVCLAIKDVAEALRVINSLQNIGFTRFEHISNMLGGGRC